MSPQQLLRPVQRGGTAPAAALLCLALAFLLSALSCGNSKSMFRLYQTITVGECPTGIAALDVNGDGRMDFVTANSKAGTISVVASTASGAYARHLPDIHVKDQPVAIAAGDLDHDGRADLVVANRDDESISVLLHSATDTTFLARVDFSVGDSPEGVGIGDFGGDGNPDICVACALDDKVWILYGDGAGHFGSARQLSVGVNPGDLAVADFDGDGRADIMALCRGAEEAYLLRSVADGSFLPPLIYDANTRPVGLAAGDLNGDGKPDIAITDAGNEDHLPAITVLRNLGGGYFNVSHTDLGDQIFRPEVGRIALADLDHDGRADQVYVRDGSQLTVSLTSGTPDGTTSDIGFTGVVRGVGGVIVADFNRDSWGDVALTGEVSNRLSLIVRDPAVGASRPWILAGLGGRRISP